MLTFRQSVTFVGKSDDNIPPSKPKPLPADFYSDTAASVQETVGAGGVDIDVDDIKGVVADDECDTNTSKIDNAQVTQFENESSERDEIRKAEKLSDSISNIDEAKVIPKDECITDSIIQSEQMNYSSDSSRIDKAQVYMEDLESQIEPTTIHMGMKSSSEQSVPTDSSKLDEVNVVSPKEDDALPSQSANENKLNSQQSRIDDAQVEKNENGGDTIKSSPSMNELESCTLQMSRIDDAEIQAKDGEVDVIDQKDTLALEQNNFSVDFSKLDSAGPTQINENEVKNEDISVDITQEVCETSSRIDHAIVEPNNDKVSGSPDQVIDNSSDSRLDNIKVPSLNGIYNADITITSPSPLHDTSTTMPEKFVIRSTYNFLSIR